MSGENKRKVSRLGLGGFLITVFLLMYVPSFLTWARGDSISTDIIRIGVLEDSVNAEACFVRDEEVLASPFTGTCITEVEQGEKIPANFSIATVLKSDSERILEAIKQKDMDIIKAQKEKSKNLSIFSEDVVKLENEISKKIKKIVLEDNRNNLSGCREAIDEIDELIQKKAVVAGDTGASDNYVNSLKQEKERLQSQLRANTSGIKVQSSGVISYVVDGYEDVITVNLMKDISPDTIEGVKDNRNINNFEKKNIEAGKPFAKVIKGIEYYFLVVLDEAKAQRFEVDGDIKVRLNELSKLIKGKIEYVSPAQGGKCTVAVKVDEAINETAAMRKTNVDLVLKSAKGYKVPLSSLRDINLDDMTAKIITVKANCAVIKDVKIESKNDEFAIITNFEDRERTGIGLYDTYVCRPENIKEGQVIIK